MTSYPVVTQTPPSGTGPSARVPLIAGGLRTLTVLAALAGAGVVTVLGIHVSHRQLVTSLDARIWWHAVTDLSGYRTLARYVASIGGMTGVTLISLGMAALMLMRRQPRGVVLALGAPVLATSLTEFVLKPWINHAPWGVNTFPSGHSTGAFAMAFVATILVLGPQSPVRPVALRWVIALGSILVASLVALSLVVAGFHFATDTIGGAAVALCVVPAFAVAIDAAADAYQRRRSHV